MKICVIPLDIVYADKDENIISVAHHLHQVEADTDIVVLPELFTTSFIADKKTISELAETNEGNTIAAIKRWTQFFGFAIASSFLATDENGHYYNRAFFIEPMGDASFYDKRHLFPLSEENKTYTPGSALSPIIRYRGWNIKLIVCFDLRFPVWSRNQPGQLYDLLIAPSNWPHSREFQYKTLLSARAIENQTFVIGANRTGTDKYGEYPAGLSGIYDNLGFPIQETRMNGHLYAIMHRQSLIEGRKRFPAFEASDYFSIDLYKKPTFEK